MLPISLMRAACGATVHVELKSGESVRGLLVSCDNLLNLALQDAVCANRDGSQLFRLPQCYLRGAALKAVRVPDNTIKIALDKEAHFAQMRSSSQSSYNTSSNSKNFPSSSSSSSSSSTTTASREHNNGRGGFRGGRGGSSQRGSRGGYAGAVQSGNSKEGADVGAERKDDANASQSQQHARGSSRGGGRGGFSRGGAPLNNRGSQLSQSGGYHRGGRGGSPSAPSPSPSPSPSPAPAPSAVPKSQ
eukprot:ANDGO_00224.mRNA.1 putative U6 snRNA-associated Sm-like protein LSm4